MAAGGGTRRTSGARWRRGFLGVKRESEPDLARATGLVVTLKSAED